MQCTGTSCEFGVLLQPFLGAFLKVAAMSTIKLARLNACQLLGLFILFFGLFLIVYSYSLTCPPEEITLEDGNGLPCDPLTTWHVFDVGIVLVLVFCCVPSFALGDSRQFYEWFPMLKGKLNPEARGRHAKRGTLNAHAASIKREDVNVTNAPAATTDVAIDM